MAKWLGCCYFLIMTALASCSSDLQTGLGMKHGLRPKRPLSEPEDHRQMVTIDLSALRPSLPGLILYNYGDQAPKLVQIDLSALNPQLQPHVIWPQFDQMELFNDRSFEFDDIDAIPYLTDDESLISSRPHINKMAMGLRDYNSWPDMDDITDGDIYDFLPNSRRNDELRSLQGSLPLADEVIVPLDWEEENTNRNSQKRNGFLSQGWQAGGHRGSERMIGSSSTNPSKPKPETTVPLGTTNWMPGKRKHHRETESEDETKVSQPGKKNVFVSSGWGPGGQVSAMAAARRHASRRKSDNKPQQRSSARISSQESWAIPRQYWNVPHLLGGHWH